MLTNEEKDLLNEAIFEGAFFTAQDNNRTVTPAHLTLVRGLSDDMIKGTLAIYKAKKVAKLQKQVADLTKAVADTQSEIEELS